MDEEAVVLRRELHRPPNDSYPEEEEVEVGGVPGLVRCSPNTPGWFTHVVNFLMTILLFILYIGGNNFFQFYHLFGGK